MAHIEYPLEVLEEFMSMGPDPWAEKLYKEKKAYLDSLKTKGKTKSKKDSPDEMYSDNLTKIDVEKYFRPYTTSELKQIKDFDNDMDKLEEAKKQYYKTYIWPSNIIRLNNAAAIASNGKKVVPVKQRNGLENDIMNDYSEYKRRQDRVKFMPYYDYIKDKINYKYKQGFIDEEHKDKLIENSYYAMGDEYNMMVRNLKYYKEYDDFLKAQKDKMSKTKKTPARRKTDEEIKADVDRIIKEQFGHIDKQISQSKKTRNSIIKEIKELEKKNAAKELELKKKQVIVKTPKTYKTGNIMKGKSDLIKMKTGKYAVEAEINLRKDLEPKVKRALKKAVDQELDKRIKGGRIIDLDYSSDSTDSESSSDEEDTKEYKKILKHLLSHVRDPKEKKDPRDIRDIKGIMKRLKAKSR